MAEEKKLGTPKRKVPLYPVRLAKKFRGRNSGEVHGFSLGIASKLVNEKMAAWYDAETKDRAIKAGHKALVSDLEQAKTAVAASQAENTKLKEAQKKKGRGK